MKEMGTILNLFYKVIIILMSKVDTDMISTKNYRPITLKNIKRVTKILNKMLVNWIQDIYKGKFITIKCSLTWECQVDLTSENQCKISHIRIKEKRNTII